MGKRLAPKRKPAKLTGSSPYSPKTQTSRKQVKKPAESLSAPVPNTRTKRTESDKIDPAEGPADPAATVDAVLPQPRGSGAVLEPRNASTPKESSKLQSSHDPNSRPTRSESSLLRIRTQIKEAKAAQALEAARDTEEPIPQSEGEDLESDASLDGSTRTVFGSRMAINDLPRLANQVLQQAKGDLEKSGKLKREIRESFVSALHTLYEMVLRLSESRSMHLLESQKLKTTMARESERRELQHAKTLEGVLRSYEAMTATLEGVRKDVESSRLILSHDLCRPVEETLKLTTLMNNNIKSVSETPGQLTKILADVQALGASDRPLRAGLGEASGLRNELQGIREGLAEHLREGAEKPPLELRLKETIEMAVEELRSEVREYALHRVAAPEPPGLISAVTDRLDSQHDILMAKLEQLEAAVVEVEATPNKGLRAAVEDLRKEVAAIGEVTVETAAPLRTAVEELRGEVRKSIGMSTDHRALARECSEWIPPDCVPDGVPLEAAQRLHPPLGGHHQVHVDGESRKLSYVEVLTTPRYPVMVESIDPRQTSGDIVNDIEKKVDVVGLGVGICRVRKARNQKVVIDCVSDRDRKVLSGALKDNNFTVASPHVGDPLLRLIGVTLDMTDGRVEEAFIKQNARNISTLPPDQQWVKVQRRTKGRTAATTNIIVKTSGPVWALMKNKKINLGFRSVLAVDQSPVVQCYRCLGFAHRARDCTTKECCGYCALGHDTRECPSTNGPPACINCLNNSKSKTKGHSHTAYSHECPEWQKWDRIARAAIRYC